MDLTNLASAHVSALKAQRETDRIVAAERERLNRLARLKHMFKDMLGIDVADSDVIWNPEGTCPAIVVDGLSFILWPNSGEPKGLVKGCLREDGSFETIWADDHVRTLEQLGRALDPQYRHRFRDLDENQRARYYRPTKGIEVG